MRDIYIPPEGLYFRLLGYASKHVLFSRTNALPEFGHSAEIDDDDASQYFSLIHGTGKNAGLYAIKGKMTGNVLFSRTHMDPRVGHIGGDGKYGDNWFRIEPGEGRYLGNFRLVMPSAGVALFSRTHMEPQVWNYTANEIHTDHYFSFLFEAVHVDKVEYDLKLGRIVSSARRVLASQTFENRTKQLQSTTLELCESETHSGMFEYGAGFNLAAGTTLKAAVPEVDETGLTGDPYSNREMRWGERNEFVKKYVATLRMNADPGETVRAIATIQKGEIEVPYTMYLSSEKTGVKLESKGLWRGVWTWNLRLFIEPAYSHHELDMIENSTPSRERKLEFISHSFSTHHRELLQ
ncbi:hemolytic lectin LSLb [Laetiporus sulphureus 93-53]|uniref:Hemolytic lectin LSLb n=1 Tax=Laetiporus sulphureus 93-53 TaxID=1314785 RepID=A0A165AZH5_9APHY|nr:hemolytic lectin LSLb [Laetiporus sulphureus 93-53]KZS99944.1 hemolytic lectin LSLb [Laetiporus sulphureus 93-53]